MFKSRYLSPFILTTIALVALHLVTKYYYFNDLYLKGDEPFMLFHCQQPLGNVFKLLHSGTEPNPPLIFILLHFWIKLFGISPLAAKSLPILISSFTIVFINLLGKKLNTFLLGSFISLLFIFSNLHFEISQEIKGFGLVTMLTVGSFYFFFSYIKKGSLKFLIPLIIFNAALPYTHYNAALVPIAQFVTYVFIFNQRKKIVWLIAGNLLSLLLFFPQLYIFLQSVPKKDFWLKLASTEDLKYVFLKLVGNDHAFYWIFIPFAVGPILPVFLKKKSILKSTFSFKTLYTLYIWVIIPLLLNFVLAQIIPSFRLRYVIYTSLGIYCVVGYILLNIKAPKYIYYIILLFYLFLFYKNYNPVSYRYEDWKTSVREIKSRAKPTDLLVISAPYKSKDLTYYYDRSIFKDYENYYSRLSDANIIPVANINDVKKIQLDSNTNLFFIQSHYKVVDPNNDILNYFNKEYISNYSYGGDIDVKLNSFGINKTKIKYGYENKIDTIYPWIKYKGEEEYSNKNFVEYKLMTSSQKMPFILTTEYSPTIAEKNKSIQTIGVDFNLSIPKKNNCKIVISIENNEQSSFRKELNLIDYKKGINYISSISIDIPALKAEDSILKLYIWNPEKDSIIINQLDAKIINNE